MFWVGLIESRGTFYCLFVRLCVGHSLFRSSDNFLANTPHLFVHVYKETNLGCPIFMKMSHIGSIIQGVKVCIWSCYGHFTIKSLVLWICESGVQSWPRVDSYPLIVHEGKKSQSCHQTLSSNNSIRGGQCQHGTAAIEIASNSIETTFRISLVWLPKMIVSAS